jgi:hypothetical protein
MFFWLNSYGYDVGYVHHFTPNQKEAQPEVPIANILDRDDPVTC